MLARYPRNSGRCHRAGRRTRQPAEAVRRGYVFTPGAGSRFLPSISADAIGTLGRSVNDAGVAVGWEFTHELAFAPVWLQSGGASYAVASDPCADFPFSQADDINNNEQVVGEWQHINNPQDFCLVGADAVYWGPEGGTS